VLVAVICFVCLVSARLPRSLVRTPTNLLERRTAYDCFSVSPVRSTQPQGRTDEGEAPRVSHKARFARRRDPPSLATRGRGRPRSRGVVQTAQRRAASQIKNPACPFSASSFFLRVLSLPLLLSEASTHNDAHTTRTRNHPLLSSNAMSGKKARARKEKRERSRDANAGEAIPGLLNDIVVTHVLRSDNFDDPADLARLPAVSRAMRDAVAATGLRFKELSEKRAVDLGCLSTLKRLQR
jgi:hypothetical protein